MGAIVPPETFQIERLRNAKFRTLQYIMLYVIGLFSLFFFSIV